MCIRDSYDAWDIDIYYTQKHEDIPACDIRCLEDGPLRMVIRFVYRYRASEIEQDMIVYADNRRIDFVTKADWHEAVSYTHLRPSTRKMPLFPIPLFWRRAKATRTL